MSLPQKDPGRCTHNLYKNVGGRCTMPSSAKRTRAAKLLGRGQADGNNSAKRAQEEKHSRAESPVHPDTNVLKLQMPCISVYTWDHWSAEWSRHANVVKVPR